MGSQRQPAGGLAVNLACKGADGRRPPPAQSAEGARRLADLMRLAQDGDRVAYAQLLGEATPLLRRVVRQRYRFLQSSDIEDIVQDILLSLHAARATYDPGRPFLPWLMAIARNRMADAGRRYARTAAREVAAEHLPETFLDVGANRSEGAYGDPEALRKAIQRLPHRQRKAVELLKLREMSLKEAAAFTGMSTGALKVAVHRAVRTLRAALSNEA